MTARNGSAEWRGDIRSGSGTIVIGCRPVQAAYSYGTRFGEDAGTNPEQLIAAAQAACFTMSLSSVLSAAGHVPQSLRTIACVQLRNVCGAPSFARLEIHAEGCVPGIDEEHFRRYANEAKANCPVARALAWIPEVVLTARLFAAETVNFDASIIAGSPEAAPFTAQRDALHQSDSTDTKAPIDTFVQ